MGGGAADHGQASAHPRPEPAVPEHRRKKRRARLLPRRHGVQEIPDELVAEIPDELVAEIFLRRPILADLVRASLACVSFRGLIADRYFLRRLRKLHAPPVLGFLNGYRDFFPVIPPSPFASAASAVALAADFSFSFLPAPPATGRSWTSAMAASSSRDLPLAAIIVPWWCVTPYTGGTSCFPQSLQSRSGFLTRKKRKRKKKWCGFLVNCSASLKCRRRPQKRHHSQ
ncbi:uncharacterized protein [Triticum aestivum]|uniref:uncharacterized protein n=1 Tax=Triticum aestivum TaxID=4565 RepID=UPI001D009FA1|nr:uncharacterized protein LOC123143178 [Triticum aestivum]XP_044417958.1 uncharacterized protein LOC123143178 [Triticum aestivum]